MQVTGAATVQASAQRAWDLAADLAMAGRELAMIVPHVLDVSSRDVDEEVDRQVPLRGRVFRVGVARAVGWGLAIDLGLLAVGSASIHPVPGLTAAICAGVLIWAVFFGMVAGRNRVHNRRVVVRHAQQQMYERIAADACLRVWARQVPGSWQPYGPVPDPLVVRRAALPSAWLARWGDPGGLVRVVESDGSAESLRLIRSSHDNPVVVFVSQVDRLSLPASAAADVGGLAVFHAEGNRVDALSATARRVTASARDRATRRAPIEVITGRPVPAAAPRAW